MKLSIISPVFNEEKKIGTYLDYLSRQTVAPEIVLVDGGSKDKTLEIIGKYQKKMKNLRVYPEEGAFRSPANARNIGLRKATGDAAMFMDVDSFVPPSFAETISGEFSKHPEYKIISFKVNAEIPKKFKTEIQKSYFFRDYSRWGAPAFIMRREIVPEFDNSLGYGEDKIWYGKLQSLIWKHGHFSSQKSIGNFALGPETVREIWKRYKWYGRTGFFYYSKSGDKSHLMKMLLAILSVPLFPLMLIPLVRGFTYALRVAKKYPEGLLTIPFIEVLAFPAMAVGFWEFVLGKSKKKRGH